MYLHVAEESEKEAAENREEFDGHSCRVLRSDNDAVKGLLHRLRAGGAHKGSNSGGQQNGSGGEEGGGHDAIAQSLDCQNVLLLYVLCGRGTRRGPSVSAISSVHGRKKSHGESLKIQREGTVPSLCSSPKLCDSCG